MWHGIEATYVGVNIVKSGRAVDICVLPFLKLDESDRRTHRAALLTVWRANPRYMLESEQISNTAKTPTRSSLPMHSFAAALALRQPSKSGYN